MAGGSQLALLCAILSFRYIYSAIDGHPLLERPRISEVLVLLNSGVAALVASFVSKWLPGAQGRFDDGIGIGFTRLEESTTTAGLPKRPRRYFLPLLLILVVARLELSRWLQFRLQCSEPAIECLLPLLLATYDAFTSKRHRIGTDQDEEEEDDIQNDTFDDIAAWFQRSRIVQITGTLLLTYGAFAVIRPSIKSTVICPSSESRTKILVLQYLSVSLDAVMLVLAWRILTWSRTTKSRLRTLSAMLISSSVIIALFILVPGVIWYRVAGKFQFAEMYGVDPLYFFDVSVDSMVFSVLLISSALFTCQSSPLISTSIITFVCGTLAACHKLSLLGTYEQLSHSQVTLPIYAICVGATVFMYRNQVGQICFIPRPLVAFLLLSTLIGVSVYSIVTHDELDGHPLNQIIYDTRTRADRWLMQAKTSQRLSVAVKEYRERHHGRSPPHNFDVWYDYAIQRNSPIIDHFGQIEDDILPFWGIKPSTIREEIAKIGNNRDVGFVAIKKGTVTHQPAAEPSNDALLDDLMNLIQPFAQHLPDMDLPVNLLDRPRVLASWSDRHRFERTATANKFDFLAQGVSKRDVGDATDGKDESEDKSMNDVQRLQDKLRDRQFASTWEYQRRLGQACPPSSPSRSGFYSNNRDFCSSCANPQADRQFVRDMDSARDLCHQPDMFNLHGFYMANLPLKPFSELVPMFSRSKTDRFSDILIPLSRPNDNVTSEADGKQFVKKDTRLFWRGDIGADFGLVLRRLLSGGHQERLSHLVNNVSATDYVTMCLSTPGNKDRFRYERVPLHEANAVLKFDAGISDYSACIGPWCDVAKAEFGFKSEDKSDEMKMDSRYVVVMDSDEGPPQDFLRVLRSSSIPFVGSVFKEWYTERVIPWLHFVPVDLRFHGLHSTLAYFMGLQGKGLVNGRDVSMQTQIEDAKWISEQGRQWATKAIRREDAEIYLFRLLLEWGRVINDKRDEVEFVMVGNAEKERDPWNVL